MKKVRKNDEATPQLQMFSFDDIQYRRRELRLKKWLNWALGLFVILYAAFLVIYAI